MKNLYMANTITISQKLLKKFIIQKKLSGTVSLLRYLQKKDHLKDFYAFCEQYDYKLQTSEQLSSNVLFHGSQKLQFSLIPSVSIGRCGKAEQEAAVYATSDPNYAIFLALLSLKNGGASVTATKKGSKLAVDLDFVNGPSKIKNGYVHIVSNQLFRKTKNKEYITNTPVTILFTVPVTPQDITVPIYIQTEL